MVTLPKTPNTISQTSGGNYRKFKNLNNLKNTNIHNYAQSEHPIGAKNVSPNRPSTVSLTDFQFNIPSNAVVRKIVVHYRHGKRCADPTSDTPFDCAKYNMNIPAPTISVLNTNLSAKGQAPPREGSHQTLTFNGTWDASVVNSSSFGIRINYPSNTNKNYGFILIGYAYLEIDYYTPSFTVRALSANPDKVYNHNEYSMVVDLSDANLTEKTIPITISVPSGLTFKSWNGSGSLSRPQANQLVWTPDMRKDALLAKVNNSYSRGVLLTFDTNITFSGSSTSVTRDFTVTMQDSTTPLTHTATIYKELPEETEQGTGDQSFDYDTGSETQPETKLVTVDEEFKYTLQIDDATWNTIVTTVYNWGLTEGYWSGTLDECLDTIYGRTHLVFSDGNLYRQDIVIRADHLSTNQKMARKRGISNWLTTGDQRNMGNVLNNDKQMNLTLKGTELGEDEIILSYYYQYLPTSDPVFHIFGNITSWKFLIIPAESSLSTPFYTKIEPSTEECDRLGEGYNYIAQSDMKQTTSETYTRDWYKNFRVGVFNNKIASNCSTYYEQDSTGTELTGEIRLSSLYDITDGYLLIKGDKAIDLTIDETEYNITTSDTTIDIPNEYIIPTLFEKNGNDNVILTIKQYTSDDTLVDTLVYHINFNAESDLPLTEKETDTTDYDNLTDTEIFSNAQYWTSKTAGLNTTNSVETEFTYNKDYPLYILVTGDYPEGSPSSNTIDFTEPCIIEKDQYTKRLSNGIYPTPIESTIANDDTAELTLNSFSISDPIVFYDLPLDDDYGTNTTQAVRGIEIRGDIEQSDRLILYAKLKSPTGESRQRSIVVNDYDTNVDSSNSFSIGGNGDLWGFTTLDIQNLENWEAELTISNNLEETTSNINFGNIQLVFYIETVEDQPITCYINGEDIRYYGVFLTQVKIPEGLETDTDYLKVDGTDTNDAYRQNITSKEIQIEFDLGHDCDLEANTLTRRELAKLLVNDRDEYNRPIPKRIEFSHYPDVYWEYIMEEPIEDKIDIGSYIDGKIKLKIPAGTSYDKEPTTTSNTGYINGLATISPTILIKPTNETISIIETVTGQEFHIGYTGGWNDKILEIDCENRIVWLKTSEDDVDPINLNKYVDYNSDWFRLKGEYNFTGVNCTVLTVDYQERW